MKKKIAIISIFLVVTCFSSIGIAASVNGDYMGNPIVNVLINGIKLTGLDVPAFTYNGRTMLPLRACVENMNGIVEWNNSTKTASVIKPEVSIFFVQLNDDKSSIVDVSGVIPTYEEGKKFYSEVDISGIPKGTYTIKSKIINANGTIVTESGDVNYTIENDYDMFSQMFEWDSIQLLPEVYKYIVEMKDSTGVYKTIAVKTMRYE